MINKEKQYNIVIEEGVTNIGGGLFVYNFNYLKNYKLASTIKEIEYGAFYGTNIDNLELNEGLEYIGDRAFENATIKNMNIPSTLKSIGAEAFKNSSILSESMEIPTTVQSIGVDAFKSDTEKVNEIRFKEGRESINSEMFSGDIGVKNIKINSDIKNIDCKFYLITSLENININEDNQYYCSKNGVLFNKESSKIIAYPAGKEETTYELPATTKVIGSNSFYNSKIESIEIPNGITEIGDEAFSNSSNLFYISIPSSVTNIGENIVYGCNSLPSSANASKGIHVCPDSYASTIKYKKKSAVLGENAGKLKEHKYGEVTYIWNEDKTECKAERTCMRSDDNLDEEVVQTTSQITKEATCEEAGEKTYTATFNNEAFAEQTATEEIPATGHSWGEITYKWNEDKTECTAERKCTRDETHKETETATISSQITKEATCEEAGEKTYTATFNNEAFAEQTATEEIPAKGHTAGQVVEENRVEATCTEEGHYDEVIYCTVCNKEISRVQKTIKVKGHTYSEEWTIDKEATCEETGEKSHHCTECGERTDITTIEALGHDYQIKSTTDAVCEKGGTIIYECTRCKTTKEETTPALGHKGGTPVEENRVESTCTQEGHYDEVIYCTECNTEISRIQKTIEKKEHTYSTEWTIDKEATCEETGEKSHHCTECGERTDITTIEALGHDYQIKSTTDAVCEKGGTIIYECTRCKATKQETIPATGHREEIDAAVEPTCTEKGKTEGKHCSVCGKVLVAQEEIPAKGHTAGQAVEENRVESTCTQEGHYDEVIYCTECNTEISRIQKTIEKKEHTYSTEWTIDKEATCEETGEKSHHCTECGERTDITTIEALGHDYQIKSTTDAVCEKGGTIIYECTRCKTTKEETTPALGHKGGTPVEENRVEATCTENGSYDEVTYCKVCGEKLLKEKKIIPALGHDYEKIVVQPTETEQGYTLHICKRCKDEYKDNYVPSIDKKDPIQIKDDEKDITIIEKEEQKYIIVEPNTTVDRLKEAIIIEKEYTVIDKENKQKEGILATGDKITVKDTYKTSYIIIVKGDVNEDGVIDFMGDVVMLNNYRLGLIKLSKEAILAGDMNMDGKIDFVEDIAKINNYRISAVRSLIK